MIDTSVFAIPFNIGLWEWFFLVVIWNLSIWLLIGYLDSCVHDLEFVDRQVLLTCNENRGKGRSEAWNTSEAISGCFLASRICSPQIFFGGFCPSNINRHKKYQLIKKLMSCHKLTTGFYNRLKILTNKSIIGQFFV